MTFRFIVNVPMGDIKVAKSLNHLKVSYVVLGCKYEEIPNTIYFKLFHFQKNNDFLCFTVFPTQFICIMPPHPSVA